MTDALEALRARQQRDLAQARSEQKALIEAEISKAEAEERQRQEKWATFLEQFQTELQSALERLRAKNWPDGRIVSVKVRRIRQARRFKFENTLEEVAAWNLREDDRTTIFTDKGQVWTSCERIQGIYCYTQNHLPYIKERRHRELIIDHLRSLASRQLP